MTTYYENVEDLEAYVAHLKQELENLYVLFHSLDQEHPKPKPLTKEKIAVLVVRYLNRTIRTQEVNPYAPAVQFRYFKAKDYAIKGFDPNMKMWRTAKPEWVNAAKQALNI